MHTCTRRLNARVARAGQLPQRHALHLRRRGRRVEAGLWVGGQGGGGAGCGSGHRPAGGRAVLGALCEAGSGCKRGRGAVGAVAVTVAGGWGVRVALCVHRLWGWG